MITRAQAEALLTLAESLEACERLDIRLVPYADIYLDIAGLNRWVKPTSIGVRLAVGELIPKQKD